MTDVSQYCANCESQAAEIARLTAEVERLREHLSGVLHEADWMLASNTTLNDAASRAVLGRLNRARTALAAKDRPFDQWQMVRDAAKDMEKPHG
jgi:hypothetical protein